MELYKVYFVSEEIARNIKPEPYWACISITEPGREAELQKGWSNILRLQFHDTGGKYNNDDITLSPMTGKQAEEVLDFLEIISTDRETRYLIVHCYAGVSRSAAVALFAHEHFTPVKYKLLGTDNHNSYVRNLLKWEFHKRQE